MRRNIWYLVLVLAAVLAASGRAATLDTATITISDSEHTGNGGSLTISFGDSAGNNYAETVNYGRFSTSVSIASAFGAMFSNQYVPAGLCAHANGPEIVFQLKNGATLGTPTVGSNVINNTVTPTITGILPNAAAVGATVIINGDSFGSVRGTVTFNGVAATSITSWGGTAVVVTVPAGATTGNVVVTAGGQISNAVPFTVSATCNQ